MSFEETHERYCLEHKIHYRVTYTLSGASHLVGNPAYPNAGSIIRTKGGCSKCARESAIERREILRKERQEELRNLPSRSIKRIIGLAVAMCIVLFFMGFFKGCMTVPGRILDMPDPGPYFGYIFSQMIKGSGIGAIVGAVIGVIWCLLEYHRLRKDLLS